MQIEDASAFYSLGRYRASERNLFRQEGLNQVGELMKQFLSILVMTAAALAQQQPTTTIVKNAELVTVPVVVTDKSGHPVRGLTREDFTIFEDGRTQRPVSLFEELQGLERPRMQGSNNGDFSNFAAADERPYRLTIIVLDLVNTPFSSQARARDQLLTYLSKNLQPDEPIALLTIGRRGLQQIHAFTTDPQVLIAALKKVTGKISPMEEAAAMRADAEEFQSELSQINSFRGDSVGLFSDYQQREAIRITMEAMEQIAQAYAGLPGRKALLWASSGFPFLLEDPLNTNSFGTDMIYRYERAWKALNAGNIAVYPVDAEGLYNPDRAAFDVARRSAPPMIRPNTPTSDTYYLRQATFQNFADATGGRPCYGRNDLANCFAQAARDSDAYYLLGYYLPENERKPGWHKLKVTVAKNDVVVRARGGFLIPENKPASEENLKTELATALISPVDYTGLHMFAKWTEQKPDLKDTAKVVQKFEVSLAPNALTIDPGNNNHLSVDIAAMAFTEKGKNVAEVWKKLDGKMKPESVAEIRKNGFGYRDAIVLPKGNYTVKFVVRDNLSGKMGTVSAPIQVK